MALDRLRASIMRADPSVLLRSFCFRYGGMLVEGYQKLLKYEEPAFVCN